MSRRAQQVYPIELLQLTHFAYTHIIYIRVIHDIFLYYCYIIIILLSEDNEILTEIPLCTQLDFDELQQRLNIITFTRQRNEENTPQVYIAYTYIIVGNVYERTFSYLIPRKRSSSYMYQLYSWYILYTRRSSFTTCILNASRSNRQYYLHLYYCVRVWDILNNNWHYIHTEV